MAIMKYQRPNGLVNLLQSDLFKILDQGLLSTGLDKEQSLNAGWSPQVDIKEDAEKYIVHADIPGVNGKDIKISLDNNVLTIEGERVFEDRKESENYSRLERFEGSFQRQFTLPKNIDSNKIAAKTKDGVLEVVIPKVEAASTKYINVEHH